MSLPSGKTVTLPSVAGKRIHGSCKREVRKEGRRHFSNYYRESTRLLLGGGRSVVWKKGVSFHTGASFNRGWNKRYKKTLAERFVLRGRGGRTEWIKEFRKRGGPERKRDRWRCFGGKLGKRRTALLLGRADNKVSFPTRKGKREDKTFT